MKSVKVVSSGVLRFILSPQSSVLTSIFLFIFYSIGWACPVCFGDLEPQQSKGFFWGIVFLIALPPALILFIAGHVIHSSRKKARMDRLLDEADDLMRRT